VARGTGLEEIVGLWLILRGGRPAGNTVSVYSAVPPARPADSFYGTAHAVTPTATATEG